MKLLAIVAVALVFAQESSADFANFVPTINAAVNYYAHTFGANFLNTKEASYASRAIASSAENAVDTRARDHVIITRGSYKSFVLAVDMIINEAQVEVKNDILSKQDWFAAIIPDVTKAMVEFDDILHEKECDWDSSSTFFNGLKQGVELSIVNAMNDGVNTYVRMMRNQFIPVHMVSYFFEQIESCFDKVDGLNCLIEKEELFQRSTLELLRNSAATTTAYLKQLNELVAKQIYKGIGQEVYKGYTTVWNYPCNALT